jgi:hypothetical protein
MLTLFVIPLFLLGAKRSPALTLAASGVVWAAAQLFPDLAPHLATRSYFNWLSWQFLFSIGMFVGMRRGFGAPLAPSQQRFLLGCAWAIVIATLGYRMLVFVGPKAGLNVDWLHLSEVTIAHMKENLSALRLVHFLSVALLVGTYLKSNNSFFANAAAQAVIQTGRHSLEVFCLSAVCSVVLNILVILEHPFTLQRLVLDFTAILLNLMLVVALTQRQVSASSRKLATSSLSAAR